MLYTLANEGKAPKKLASLNKKQVPGTALIVSTFFLSFGVLLNYLLPEKVFTLVTSIATICFIWIWAIILVAHLRFRKLKPDVAKKSSFKMPLSPVINWIVLAFFAFVIVVLGFAADTRIALFITPVWFVIITIAYMITKKNNGKSVR
jgi:D-serine/D-alanine/glycine transporter